MVRSLPAKQKISCRHVNVSGAEQKAAGCAWYLFDSDEQML